MINPADPGPVAFDKVVYAAPGLNYPIGFEDFNPFETPTAGYATRTIDISDFADLSASTPWPFANTAVPLNGFLSVPRGAGPFPLALFAHGNHNQRENSTQGYRYLCDLLASHGILAGTIDVNFLNGFNSGENDGRAIVHLEHIRQFALWNIQAGHPLAGKVDLTRVMIMGHSRGGEAVGHASLFNRLNQVQPDVGSPPVKLDGSTGLGPYKFGLKSVVAVAPTDGQYVPVSGPTKVADNFYVIHGSRDNDVNNFPGYLTYDRSHRVDPAAPTTPAAGYKALLWVYRANHNFFNSVWAQESPNPTLSRAEQELIARVFIGAAAQAELLGNKDFRAVTANHRTASAHGWLPGSLQLVSQYQDPRRVFIQHFREAGPALAVSSPVAGGAAGVPAAVAAKLRFNLGPTSHLFQDSNGARFRWSGGAGAYRVTISAGTLPVAGMTTLALRIGQSSEAANPGGAHQDLTLSVSDGAHTASFPLSQFGLLPYPDTMGFGTAPKTIMQTIRIPLAFLTSQGLNVANLVGIELKGIPPAGVVYLNDLQVTQ